MVVCLWPHSNNGGRRSCGSSRSASSADTTRSRCAGRRRGGARSTSRYSGAPGRADGPRGSSRASRPSLGCGSPSLRAAQWKPVSTLSQAAILTYSRSQTHSLGNAHSLSLASCPGQSPLTCLDLWVLPTLGIYFEGSAEAWYLSHVVVFQCLRRALLLLPCLVSTPAPRIQGPLSSLEAHSDPAVALCRAIPLQRPGRLAVHDYFIPAACTGASKLDSIVNSGGPERGYLQWKAYSVAGFIKTEQSQRSTEPLSRCRWTTCAFDCIEMLLLRDFACVVRRCLGIFLVLFMFLFPLLPSTLCLAALVT